MEGSLPEAGSDPRSAQTCTRGLSRGLQAAEPFRLSAWPVATAAASTPIATDTGNVFRTSGSQAERDQFTAVAGPADGHHDVLPVSPHVGHGCTALRRRNVGRADFLARCLVIRPQHRPALVVRSWAKPGLA